MKKLFVNNGGFTLVEMMLTMGIIAILATISSMLLSGLIPRSSLVSATEQFTAEVKQHQYKAMIGENLGVDSDDRNKGIKIEPHQYIFFEGEVFNPSAETNYAVLLEEPLSIESNFADQTLIFEKGSGEILNFNPDLNTITISNASNNDSVSITFNEYGVITQVD